MIETRIENILATTPLGVRLNLPLLKEQLELQKKEKGYLPFRIEYDPKIFAALRLWLRLPRASITIHHNGKLICAGCNSKEKIKLSLERAVEILARNPKAIEEGELPTTLEISIQNVVCSANLGNQIGCGPIQMAFPEAKTSKFGGISTLVKYGGGTIRFFSSGKALGIGFKSTEIAKKSMTEAIAKVHVALNQKNPRQQEICKLERFDPTIKALQEYCEKLSIKTAVYEQAVRLLNTYARKLIKKSFGHRPETVAAGILYTATILQGEVLTQENISRASDLSIMAVGKAFRSVDKVVELDIGNVRRYRASHKQNTPEP